MKRQDIYRILSIIGIVFWKLTQFVVAWLMVVLFTYFFIPNPDEKLEYTRDEIKTLARETFENPAITIGQAMAIFDEKDASCWFLDEGEDRFYTSCRFKLEVGLLSMSESISIQFRKIKGQELLDYEISKEFGGKIDKDANDVLVH